MKKIYIKCFILALIAILLELFMFNFRTFESMAFTSVDSLTLAAPDGQPLEAGQSVTFADKESTEIIVDPIGAVAGNIYIDAEEIAAVIRKDLHQRMHFQVLYLVFQTHVFTTQIILRRVAADLMPGFQSP